MKRFFIAVSILLFSCAAWAQELPLGISEEKLMQVLGHPDSIVEGYDYYHHTLHGRPATFIAVEDDNNIVCDYQETIYEPDSIRLVSLYDSMVNQVSKPWPTKLTVAVPQSYQLWLSQDSLHEVIAGSGRIVDIRYLRAAINTTYTSELLEDDAYFELAADVKPLDSEASMVVNTWRAFLELTPDRSERYHIWSRHDPFIVEYLMVPYQGDFSNLYRARLTGVVKDPSLDGYILSTNFFPLDTSGVSDYVKTHGISRQITYMKLEDGYWKIVSPIYYRTKDWSKRIVGNITYHFPQQHVFNDSIARAAVHYLDSISRLFGSKPLNNVEYYFCCPGYNAYSILGINTPCNVDGRASFENSAIFSIDTSECFNHELVHLAVRRLDTLGFIEEGIASFIGDDSSTFYALCKWSEELLKANRSFTFDSIMAYSAIDSMKNVEYATGSMFFCNVFKIAGMTGVVDFYKLSINESGFYNAVEKYLHIKRKNIEKYWREEIAKYGARYTPPPAPSTPLPPPAFDNQH